MGAGDDGREFVEGYVRMLASQGRAATALGEVARWGRVDLIEALLEDGLGVDERTESDHTPLMPAASGGQPHAVGYLIERGADVNAVSKWNGVTPLIACVAALHPDRIYIEILESLLKNGAVRSLGARDATGRTALDWARDGRPGEVITLLESDPTA